LVLAVLVYVVSRRFYPVQYEWSRLFRLVVLFGLVCGTGLLIRSNWLLVTIGIKLILLLLCPLVPYVTRFFAPEELTRMGQLLAAGRLRLGEWFRKYRFSSQR
jgi:uncharacterized membrane protein